MKKLLALVLALVMTLGLATVAANASYPDDADVEYKEAVDVMSAVGVFQGDEKGNFMPKANLDRAAAAKLIAYLDLGEKAAEALPAVKVFNDVPASHWAAKYIAYCANAGYIAGAGDGNFYPSNPLTGYAFGKMILCVLGYDASIEGFTGATWSINVAKLMDDNDIDDGVDAAASATLTREQAAKYCLNAIKADMVEYDDKGTSIEINGAKIATGASKADSKTTKSTDKKYTAIDRVSSGDEVVQLGEKLYSGDLEITSKDSDAFGAPAIEWKYKNSSVGIYADTPDASYKNKVTQGTIYTLLGKDLVDDVVANKAIVNVSVNGGTATPEAVASGWKNNSGAAFKTDNGMLTEVYINDDGGKVGGATYDTIVTVVVKNVYVMQATDDYNTRTEKLAVDPLFAAAFTGNSVDDKKVADGVSFDSFKEDDYILYTYADSKIQSMEKAETLTGKVTGYTSGKNVTIDGTKYSYNITVDKADNKNGKAVTYKTNEEATVVLDALGYIIYVDEAQAANDKVFFVVKVDAGAFDTRAQVVTVDGKKQIITVDEDDSDKTINENAVYSYKQDGSEYELKAYSDSAAVAAGQVSGGKVELNKNYDLAGGKKIGADTVYIVEENNDITVYTGTKNAPDKVTLANASQPGLYVYDDDDVTYVYVKAAKNGVDEHSTSDDQLIYVLKVDDTERADADDNKYFVVTALVDGVETDLNVDASLLSEVERYQLYTKQKVNSDGYVTSLTKAEDSDDDYDEFTVSGKTAPFDDGDRFMVESKGWDVKNDKVYLVVGEGVKELLDDDHADFELSETTMKGLKNFVKGYTVSAEGWVALNDDDEVTAVYVTITGATEN